MEEKKYKITKKESERINILKTWLIIMVVIIHIYNGNITVVSEEILQEIPVWFGKIKYIISEIICSCAVQSFVFISSILLYKKEFKWKENLIKKTKTLLIPYLILNTLWILFYFIFQNISISKGMFTNPNNVISKWNLLDWINAYTGYKTRYPFLYPLWFLRDLFALNILASIIKRIVFKIPNISFIVFMIMWLFLNNTYIFFLSTTTICFWGFGCYFVRKGIKLESIDKVNKKYIWIGYIGIILLDFLTTNCEVNVLVHRFSILAGVIFWFACTTKLRDNKIKKIVLYISSYSFSIYLFHEIILTIIRKIYTKLCQNSLFFGTLKNSILLTAIISVLGCIGLSIVIQKKFPKIYSIIVGNRSNKEMIEKDVKQ